MKTTSLNNIATLVAVAIAVAIILGIALEIAVSTGVSYYAAGSDWSPTDNGGESSGSHLSGFPHDSHRSVQMLADRIVTIAEIMDAASDSERGRIIASVMRPNFETVVRDAPIADQPASNADADQDHRSKLVRQLIEMQLEQPGHSVNSVIRRHMDEGGADALQVEVSLRDGRWLGVTVPRYAAEPDRFSVLTLRIGLLFILVSLISVWTGRRLAAPIREFAAAAERLGIDATASPLTEQGPHELRVAIRTFNRMQERLRRLLQDRTQMLAAMSHDLRAPLARLRLRAEFVEDEEQQRKMFGDLDAMNAMIDTTLAFARDDTKREPRRLVDLGVLVEDVCEDTVDAGGAASCCGTRGIDVPCRPTAIRRALANLVDNAVKYGGAARVRMGRENDRVIILVEDDGPGIPVEEQEKVFAPFYRLGSSRSPDKGGVGLGLSVARTIAREHGGDITLSNGEAGSVCVRLELPA